MPTLLLTTLAMIAFSANSLLGRAALKTTAIDPVSYTLVRLAAGAAMLAVLVSLSRRRQGPRFAGGWAGGLALFAYAIAFSWAYVAIPAGAGAVILFGAVQVTMIGAGWARGERLTPLQWLGFVAACAGLVVLMRPGLEAPSLLAASLMALAGVAWGVYSLVGRGAVDPLAATAGNFARAALLSAALAAAAAALARGSLVPDPRGAGYAVMSGAVTSAIGYAIWYAALPGLSPATASVVQLSVPVLASLMAVVTLDEPVTVRLVVCAVAILGGVAVVILGRRRR